MARFRTKSVEVEAVLWDGNRVDEVPKWISAALQVGPDTGGIMRMGKEVHVFTLDGVRIAKPMEWIVRGAKGELYPCAADTFLATYEPAKGS